MKRIFKVTILFCFIIGLFVIPSFADTLYTSFTIENTAAPSANEQTFNNSVEVGLFNHGGSTTRYTLAFYPYITNSNYTRKDAFYFYTYNGSTYEFNVAYNSVDNIYLYIRGIYRDSRYGSYSLYSNGASTNNRYDVDNDLWYVVSTTFTPVSSIPAYSSISDALTDIAGAINAPIYNKNENVDEFIANTLISMGIKFNTPADALSYASAAWDWCTDEDNVESAHPFDEWNIDTFVSYCNAQSNNYLNWYNGYKVHEDVVNALGTYITENIRSLTGLPAGVTSLNGGYLPQLHYGSGFNSGISKPTAQTFYPAQTITYFNGEYVNETDDISTSQFLYAPADVRRFLGYPASGTIVNPGSPASTGTITNDPNNPDQKNISINFPSLDWLADAIRSILDFLRDAFTTLANLLTQLLDAILGLFSDAFESLQDFGQGIIDFIQSVFSGLSDLLSGYVPSDISVIIVTFIALNFGIGLITFVLKGH